MTCRGAPWLSLTAALELQAKIKQLGTDADEDKARLLLEAQQVGRSLTRSLSSTMPRNTQVKDMYRRAVAGAEVEQTRAREALDAVRDAARADTAGARGPRPRGRGVAGRAGAGTACDGAASGD